MSVLKPGFSLGQSLGSLTNSLNFQGLTLEILKVEHELRRLSLQFRPHYFLADEWFCPDSSTSVGIPFFVLHPQLKQLEKKYVGYIDGGSKSQCLKLLRHEIGHAVDHGYRLSKREDWSEIFGDSKTPYPRSYQPMLYSKRFVQHIGDGYAQSHPSEDFAETFAVWLNPHSNWRQKYKGTQARLKLNYVDQLMRSLDQQECHYKAPHRKDLLKSNKQSLRIYYQRKQKRLRPIDLNLLESDLRLFFDGKQRKKGRSLHSFLRNRTPQYKKILSQQLGTQQYKIEPVLKEFCQTAKRLDLRLISGQKRSDSTLLDLLTAHSIEYFGKGRDKVIM